MGFEPANKAFFWVENLATDLDARWSNPLFVAALKRTFAHAEILGGLSFRHTTKSQLDRHVDNRELTKFQMKQPDRPPNGGTYARMLREL